MIITCPTCATAFNVAAESLGEKGRMVRCSKCGLRWLARSAGPPPPEVPAASAARAPAAHGGPPSPSAAEQPEPWPPPRGAPGEHRAWPLGEPPMDAAPLGDTPPPGRPLAGSGGAGLVGWLLLALLVLALAAAILGRNQIVAMAPQLVPYYRMAGLPLTIESGLEIANLVSTRVTENGKPVLVVSGEIHNISGSDRELPPVRVALLDADRNEIDFGLFDVDRRVLPPGGMTRFEARLVDPPPSAKSFRVTLRDAP